MSEEKEWKTSEEVGRENTEAMSSERWQELANICASRGGDQYLKEALHEIRRLRREDERLSERECFGDFDGCACAYHTENEPMEG